MIKNLSIFMLLILFSQNSNAGVFRCVGPTGYVVFRDTPCESALERQEVLPYESQPTSAKVVREEEREVKAILKKFSKQEKDNSRLENRLTKQVEKEEKKQERLSLRCERTREKITEIETELRLGCKVGRCQRLKKERKHHEAIGRRYCAGEV
jgi:tRNA(Ser,Leu) C12 N-acetylase TAN1